MNDIARSFNIKTVSNISACCKHKKIVDKNGKTYYCRTAYGYKWEYEKEA